MQKGTTKLQKAKTWFLELVLMENGNIVLWDMMKVLVMYSNTECFKSVFEMALFHTRTIYLINEPMSSKILY